MKKRRKVFVLNDGGHNYTDAERFGEIVICTTGTVAKDNISMMYRQLSDTLIDAHAEDLIMVSGLTSLCMVAAAMMADQFGEVHMLVHKDGKYEERDLMLR